MKKAMLGYQSRECGALFLLCWLAYFSTYICRLNFSAIIPKLLESGSFTQSETASVSSAFFICYGVGQLFSGVLGDRFSSRSMIFTGVFVSGISNVFMFFGYRSYRALLLLWALNGAAQSLVWAPILHIAGDFFSLHDQKKFGVDISTTVPLGTLASYGVSLLTLCLAPWRYVFLSCGVCVLLVSLCWLFGTARLFPKLQKSQADALPGNSTAETLPSRRENASSDKRSQRHRRSSEDQPLGKILSSSGVFILFLSIIIQGTLKDSVTQWIPAFLDNQFRAGTSISLALTMLLPLINVTGAYFAKAVNQKLQNELSVSAVFFGIAAGFLAVLMSFGKNNIFLALLCMAGVTNSMFAVNVMLITMVPLRFAKFGRASTVGGLLNAVAYIGCGLLNLGAGALLEQSGSAWNNLFLLWLCLAAGALLITGLCCIRWKRCIKEGGILDG